MKWLTLGITFVVVAEALLFLAFYVISVQCVDAASITGEELVCAVAFPPAMPELAGTAIGSFSLGAMIGFIADRLSRS